MAMKMFFQNIKNEKFTPIENSTYSLFDPQLRISGQPIRFILNREDPDSFKGQHFKFLGRWIHAFLKEHLIKEKIKKEILNEIQVVDNCLLNGFMKLWLYQFYVLYHFSWPFLIHDLDKILILKNGQKLVAQLTIVFFSGQTKSMDLDSLAFQIIMKKCNLLNVNY